MNRLVCYLLGHTFKRLADEPAPKGWWWEIRQCKRCGFYYRELVAGREG